ncbi:MAG: hypothetical protein WC423_21875, partial [Vulcanimicrobiota bacterium]
KTPYSGVSPLKAGHSNRIEGGNNPVNFVDPEGLEPLGRASSLTNRHFDGSRSIDGSGRDFRNGVSIVGVGLLAGPGGGLSASTTGLRYLILTQPELAAALVELGFGFAVGGDAGPRPNLCTGSLKGLRANIGAAGAGEIGPRVLQTGGHKINADTASLLNRYLGTNYHKRDLGRALESMKGHLNLPPSHHGKLLSNGDYLDQSGNYLGNIEDFLP